MSELKLQKIHEGIFLEYAESKKNNYNDYNYLTKSILKNTFNYFLKNKLTIKENGYTYFTNRGEKEIISHGTSDGDKLAEKDILESLFLTIFCKSEWMARSQISFYSDTCIEYIGIENYEKIIEL